MSLTLKPYPEYKESWLPWLGAIPAHWSVRRAKQIFSPIDVRSKDGNEELLTVSSKDSVLPRSQKKVTMFKAESYIGYKLCWPGDLVINSLWAWARGLGFSRHHGIVSSAYGVYRPKPQFASAFPYFDFLLRSNLYDWELHVRSKGIWVSRLQLTDESFFDMPIVVPPMDEAEKMAAYIKVHDLQIRKLIRAKRRVIELLNEQKQAIIQRAVTRGLDPNVRLKPSGIEWLGEVPEHWQIIPLKRVVTRIEQGWSPQCDAQPAGADEWGVLKVGCVNGDLFSPDQNKKLPTQLAPLPELEITPGDILVSRANTRSLVGLAALVDDVRPKLLLCDKLFRFRAIPKSVVAKYLVLAMRIPSSRSQIEAAATGASSSMQNVGQGTIANLQIPLPPVNEQHEILSELDTRCRGIVGTIDRAEREIDLLREYRTRLIADVVTGKLDVRGVELPELNDVEEVSDVENEELDDSEELEAVEENVDAD